MIGRKIILTLSFIASVSAFAIDLPAPVSKPVETKEAPAVAPLPPASRTGAAPGARGPAEVPKVVRKKELNFEGRGVEVLLGKDYDSLSQTGTVEPANRDKLYKTRQFMNESENLLQELEYTR